MIFESLYQFIGRLFSGSICYQAGQLEGCGRFYFEILQQRETYIVQKVRLSRCAVVDNMGFIKVLPKTPTLMCESPYDLSAHEVVKIKTG